jgi:hypothetical protein
MASKLRTWWQLIKPHRGAIVVVAIVLVVVIALIVVGYRFGWTGFTGKTLWDWLQLLIVPLALAIGGFWLSQIQKTTEERHTTDNQREAALQAYIDKISELLLEETIPFRGQTAGLVHEALSYRNKRATMSFSVAFSLPPKWNGLLHRACKCDSNGKVLCTI